MSETVFEGEISERDLHRLQKDIAARIDPKRDTVAIYWSVYPGKMKKICIGKLPPGTISVL